MLHGPERELGDSVGYQHREREEKDPEPTGGRHPRQRVILCDEMRGHKAEQHAERQEQDNAGHEPKRRPAAQQREQRPCREHRKKCPRLSSCEDIGQPETFADTIRFARKVTNGWNTSASTASAAISEPTLSIRDLPASCCATAVAGVSSGRAPA